MDLKDATLVFLTESGAHPSLEQLAQRAYDQIASGRGASHVLLSDLIGEASGKGVLWSYVINQRPRPDMGTDPYAIAVRIGPHLVCKRGMAVPFDPKAAHAEMQKPRYAIEVRVGRGPGSVRLLTCDLTAEYVRINAEYTT